MAVWQVDPARMQTQMDLIDAELKHLRILQELLQQYAQAAPEKQAQIRRLRQEMDDFASSRAMVRQTLDELQDKTRKLTAAVQDDIDDAASAVMRLF